MTVVVDCFTSASFAYLDRVRVLAKTLKTHHPDWRFWLILSDREPDGFRFKLEEEPIDAVVRVDDFMISNFYGWLFKHDVVELCTAVKGLMLDYLLEKGAQKVVYLDPDIAVLAPLDHIIELLDTADIVLTPHQLDPDSISSAIIDNEIGSMKYGIYNLGFFAVANRPEGGRFARWWRDRLLEFCFDDVPNGLFTDQKWCDHVPVFFPSTHILRDRGYNVASWNQSQRPITIDLEGNIRSRGDILRFFHFTKVTWIGELMLERYAGDRVEIFELLKWYKGLLEQNSVAGLPKRWWAFSNYSNGADILPEHRVAYRRRADLQRRFPDPYKVVPGGFLDVLAQESAASRHVETQGD